MGAFTPGETTTPLGSLQNVWFKPLASRVSNTNQTRLDRLCFLLAIY